MHLWFLFCFLISFVLCSTAVGTAFFYCCRKDFIQNIIKTQWITAMNEFAHGAPSKLDTGKPRFFVQWNDHARYLATTLCSQIEHQSLTDLTISCGSNTLHVHKCILAANSAYFMEQLEKDPDIEQVVIIGLDFVVVKSIVEYIYCGEANIYDEHLKFTMAAAKFLQIKGLQMLFADNEEFHREIDSIQIVPPTFLSKKPKYPNAFQAMGNPQSTGATLKSANPADPCHEKKVKRKMIRSDAEKACSKEAAASRMALEALQRELSSGPHISSFVVDESCTETTVENFIPHTEEGYIQTYNQVPMQVSFANMAPPIVIPEPDSIMHTSVESNSPCFQTISDKIRSVLGDVQGNVELMYKTNSGNFVAVTDDVLQNIADGTLQYQIVDEDGHVGEVQELRVPDEQAHAGDAIRNNDDAEVGNSAGCESANNSGNEQINFTPLDNMNQELTTLSIDIKNETLFNPFSLSGAGQSQTLGSLVSQLPASNLENNINFSEYVCSAEQYNNLMQVRENKIESNHHIEKSTEAAPLLQQPVMTDNVPESSVSKNTVGEDVEALNLSSSNVQSKSLPIIDDFEYDEFESCESEKRRRLDSCKARMKLSF